MAEEAKNITISKTNSGFPDYLDFDKLRTEGIDYIGRLAGKIWTDHNAHDPGITILEVLCYALLDLGYRTNLPAVDVFTRDPDTQSGDNNFFTPAHILTCNPLTIVDFRKLLIDIKGVKNAWLEIDTGVYNGLYHVYLDLENEVKKEEEKDIITKVKETLMAHRNLCEDFIDVYVLCKKEIGVCADIELEENADAEQVYMAVVEKLRGFFSPAPQFYTLQQLLDKQKPIEDIFAGRPYNITDSHGFVDTEELKQLALRKEIHLSDVYHAIFDVEGVQGVSDLHLQSCDGNAINDVWRYRIPERHVPEFSLACSGFQFNRKGRPVFIDFKKFEGLFAISFTHNGKIAYQMPSPYLDVEIPQGTYYSDLADYYSIQNEFPRVYGIAEGGLSESASAERKAQALQLKAWLLFFDQLLANYLAQLKNVHSLFAMSSPDAKDNHTYFINQLTTVPGHQKLVRFNLDENNDSVLGTEGSVLVFPVEKKKLTDLAEQDKLKLLSLEEIDPYTFSTLAELDTAISQLKNDLYFQQYQCEYVTKKDECVFYYIYTSSNRLALICKKYFKDIAEAKTHATSVHYIGTFDENYRSFSTSDNSFSFNLELNLRSFSSYLQLIVEDKTLFYKRRQSFLNHLLARFAEQFTDYALLAFGFQDPHQLQQYEIRYKENYLTHYDALSSNRGRAYDYLENGWNNKNISGFEKKVRALSGIADRKRRSLCNFVVAKYDEQFAVTLKMAGTSYFSAKDKFDSEEEALKATQSIFLAMKEGDNYKPKYIRHDRNYRLDINYENDRKALFPFTFDTEEEAVATAGRLSGLFVKRDPEGMVFISSYIYIPELIDASGNKIRRSITNYPSEQQAKAATLKTIKKINDRKQWEYDEKALGSLYYISYNEDHLSFINSSAFKIDIDNSVIDKPDVFTYELLDKENTFKFNSTTEFKSANSAKKSAQNLLALLTNESNYEIFQDEASKFYIRIRYMEKTEAVGSAESDSQEEILKVKDRILGIIKNHQYTVDIDKQPNRWKFNYQLGYEKNNLHHFESIKNFKEKKEAMQMATLFIEADPALQLSKANKDLTLTAKSKDAEPIIVKWTNETGDKPASKTAEAVKQLLVEKKEISRLNKSNRPENFQSGVRLDEISRQGLYVYRMVDKDNIPAFYNQTFSDENEAKANIKALSERFKQPVDHLQLCMGGEHIIHKIKDKETNKYWYHYQIKSLLHFYKTGEQAGKLLVLFESTKGYESAEEAERAFKENYLYIIHLASDASNYNNLISLEEILIHHPDPYIKSDCIVFIPKTTLEDLGDTPDHVIKELVNLSKNYPIRLVPFESKEFYDLFPCEKKIPREKNRCKKEGEKFVYYFILRSPEERKWQSTKYFTSPEEAGKAFDFFLMLLCYPGNYFVDCDPCNKDEKNQFHIYVREVLAESTERFRTEREAWSSEGIQKFICIAQSEDPFHTYLRKSDCCYSFYVSCKNGFIYHPCKYDTAHKRDRILLALYQSLKAWIRNRYWQIEDAENNLLLLDGSGKAFAAVERVSDNYCRSDLISILSESASKDENYKESDEKIILTDDDNNTLAISTMEDVTLAEWKEALRTFLCLYPIVKNKYKKGGSGSYCIEIKLPGFNTCKEDRAEDMPCGCENKDQETDYDCHVAWRSRCCYDNCWEAERALQTFLKLLQQYEFYQPVFDCVCNSFGITLQFEKNSIITHENITWYEEDANIANWQNSEIVAINPQCYPCKEAACTAVDRAKKLINSEGLHLVEHILLRPHCPEEERCPQYNKQCEQDTGCEFVWKVPDEDPCLEEASIDFVPGADPYSFIATVVLPAWPERFRKKENRALLENLIYREAPAHVLLRILWLAPHDFCCFENKFKNWNRWLAMKKTCIKDFSVCDFLEFLFDRNYECLEDCLVCEPCNEESTRQSSCFAKTEEQTDEKDYLNQINRLYCWEDQHCDRYQYIDCENQSPDDDNPNSPEVVLIEKDDQPQPIADPAISAKKKSQAVNTRLMKYKTSADAVVEKSKNNPIAAKAQSFMTDPKPEYDRLSRLTTEILQNKRPKTKGSKMLTKSQKQDLLENIICYWLDRHCFNGKDMNELNRLSDLIKKLSKAKISPGKIYKYWNFPEIKQYEPELNENKIKMIFKG